MITYETRQEGYQEAKKKSPTRCMMIYNYLLENGPSTAEEIRNALGFTDMNAVRPRLTELCYSGVITTDGKKKGSTGVNTAVWKVKEKAAPGVADPKAAMENNPPTK